MLSYEIEESVMHPMKVLQKVQSSVVLLSNRVIRPQSRVSNSTWYHKRNIPWMDYLYMA